jgi:hypothetical protein
MSDLFGAKSAPEPWAIDYQYVTRFVVNAGLKRSGSNTVEFNSVIDLGKEFLVRITVIGSGIYREFTHQPMDNKQPKETGKMDVIHFPRSAPVRPPIKLRYTRPSVRGND